MFPKLFIIEGLPDFKLADLERYIKILAMPEETPTKEDLEAIRRGEEEITNDEFTTYTREELKREFLNA